ncbi:D-alanyl-D-alanine carboxypeptidase family protein [Salinarimonas soli]|uniref:serine-type D-Ala-D-Ala carboxypeptidase n=1 Tax=Salinarimonas soli TaxID=1638099 RepID=A0A5B2VR23_9HYPH|nr:D-alanyl-D-alanine carboxypeptidase family protein [Salinarimonas soli]KAA2241118.1 D-alanyl-D-alanine carboxypeptidase [Salinarimonas soli]
MRRVEAWSLHLLTILGLAALLAAPPALAQNFQTAAPQAILVDAGSGTVLFEKAADEPMAPASMAKIMTVEVVFDQLKQGKLTLDSEFPISEGAWRRGGGPSGGSSMFAQVGSRIKLGDLLRGIIVQSGNDAAIAVAEGIAGNEDNFARMMTARARELGLANSTFRNATGFGHPDQKVTARDLAKLTLHVIETYPDLYKIFKEEEFTWNRIRQRNRNPLLSMDIGADGVKTGNIDESGFGLVGSAVQNGQRLIVVVNGLKNSRDRANEARKLLDWGFRAFEARQLFAEGEPVGGARVFGGSQRSVPLIAKKPISVLVPRGANERISAKILYTGPLTAPVKQGAPVARLRITRGEIQALDIPLYAAEEVGVGSLPQRALDGALELGGDLFRRGFAAVKGS